jgi:hypothetical protein
MQRIGWVLLVLFSFMQANIYIIPDDNSIAVKGKYARNKKCVRCHLDIYKEFKHSAHHHANILNNAAHRAMWQSNPLSREQKYLCAKCHAPATEEIDQVVEGKEKISQEDHSAEDGISCAFCHRIKDVHPTEKGDHYIIDSQKRHYYGGRKSRQKSDFHQIDSNNTTFQSGSICLTCHAHHKKQKILVSNPTEKGYENFCIFSQIETNITAEGCISCHMPEVEGSFTDRYTTPTHRSHRFLGLRNRFKGIERYLDINLTRSGEVLSVALINRMPHAMILHPTRMFKLQVFVDGKLRYEKVFEKESRQKHVRPFVWLKERVVYADNLAAKDRYLYHLTLHPEDKQVKAVLGYYLIKPEIAQRIGLTNKKDTTFHILLERILKTDRKE